MFLTQDYKIMKRLHDFDTVLKGVTNGKFGVARTTVSAILQENSPTGEDIRNYIDSFIGTQTHTYGEGFFMDYGVEFAVLSGTVFEQHAVLEIMKYVGMEHKFDHDLTFKELDAFNEGKLDKGDFFKLAFKKGCLDIKRRTSKFDYKGTVDNIDIMRQVYKNVVPMLIKFRGVFFESGLIRKDSKIVVNPLFGNPNILADGDIIIDDILYDFKCIKTRGFKQYYARQLYMYCALSEHKGVTKEDWNERGTERIQVPKYDYGIKGCAIYNARYGDIHKVEFEKGMPDSEICYNILAKFLHGKYLEGKSCTKK